MREWLVLGPLPYGEPEDGRLERDLVGGEAGLAGATETAESRRWRKVRTKGNLLDFRDLFAGEPSEHAAAYALVHVLARKSRWTTVAVGSDDGVSVRVNGLLFHAHDVPRGHHFGDDKVRVKLRRGWNRLLFKVVNGEGGFALSARFEEPEGLEFSVESSVDRWVGPPEAPEIVVRTVAAADPVWDARGPSHRFVFDVMNVGGQACPAALELRSGDGRTVDSWRSESLDCWTAHRVEFQKPLRGLLAEDARLPSLAVDDGSGAKPQPIDGLDAPTALDRLLGPYRLGDGLERGTWSTSHGTNEGTWVRVRPPPDLSGLAAEAEARHPGRASVWVNGKEIVPRFSGSTGWFRLGDPEEGRWSIATAFREERERMHALAPVVRVRFAIGALKRAATELRVAKEFAAEVSEGFERLLAATASGEREAIEGAAARVSEEVRSRVDPRVKKAALHLAGNAHIDLAWLWRIPETKQVCRDTFRAALDNMKRYPDFTFSHGSAQSYAWMEEEEPALFEEIRGRIKEGRWEVVGGTWAESDTNMPTGESLVRQWLYGKRYFAEKFGVDVRVGWMPDTFGHPATLPTIARGCGLDAYVFFRPWEEARTFRWRGPDGSEVIGIRPPRWYMVEADGIDPALGREAIKAGDKTGLDEQLVLVGTGDHGGGPTRDAIEKAALFDSLEAFPSVQFGKAEAFVDRLKEKAKVTDVHEGEVNFVFPGCWTSQGDHKRRNRRAEHELPAAETVAALASLNGYEVPKEELTRAWRLALLNQFHDLLCGSGIDEIYEDAADQYEEVFEVARATRREALRVLVSKIDTASVARGDRAFVVWNPLPWKRSDLVQAWVLSEGPPFAVFDERGRMLTPVYQETAGATAHVSFVARDVPGCGWRTYRIGPAAGAAASAATRSDLALRFDERAGTLASLSGTRDWLAGAGGDVRVFEDRGNAWELPIEGEGAALEARAAVAWEGGGTLSGRHAGSTVSQDFDVHPGLGRVDAQVRIDWKDRHRAVKIAWPFALGRGRATFEIPFGAIERPADGKEVPAIRWVDVSDGERGVAILNDGRYGFDVEGSRIRITAHRAPTDPGKTAGIGSFEFRYAVVPHEGDWRDAEIPKRGVEFNSPLEPWIEPAHGGEWPAVRSLLSVEGQGVIASAFKKAEEGDAFVLRLYEAHGREAKARVALPFEAKKVEETDHLERGGRDLGVKGSSFDVALRPHEVKTLRVTP